MMDIEKLIERLKSQRGALFEHLYVQEKQDMDEAATALSTLQADVVRLNNLLASYQNVLVPELRVELERVKQERDAAVKDLEILCRDDVGPCEMAICELCAYNSGVQCSNPDGRSCDGYDVFNWKWRGPQKED